MTTDTATKLRDLIAALDLRKAGMSCGRNVHYLQPEQTIDLRSALARLLELEANPKLHLQAGVEAGATFHDVLAAWREANPLSEADEKLLARARELHHREGELEIDDLSVVSGLDPYTDGDYVLAWVWTPLE